MSENKVEIPINPPINPIDTLPADLGHEIAKHLSMKESAHLLRTSKTKNLFAHPILKTQTFTCVVEGNVDSLKGIIQRDPESFFEKGQAKAPRGQRYFKLSPYQLMKFLCDKDMQTQIMPLIPEEFDAKRQTQDAEMGCGGADLIKLEHDPLELIKEQGFKAITEFKTSYALFDGTRPEVTFPLLENPDGIFYYQDANKEVHLYYANRETQAIQPLDIPLMSEEDQQEFEQFKASFNDMENNSGRRSNDKEHQLIQKILGYILVRKGIQYEHKGILYRDSRSPFNLINAYRKCIRLYEEGDHNNQWDKTHTYWREGVGMAQGEEMWLLQRLCEKDRPFYPLPKNFDDFKRGFEIYNYVSRSDESVFSGASISVRLGSGFAIYGGRNLRCSGLVNGVRNWIDLITVCRLVEDAKAKVVELSPEIKPHSQSRGAG